MKRMIRNRLWFVAALTLAGLITPAVFADHVCDHDGDGWNGPQCSGPDCNDGDALIHPGAVEVCDALDVDEDCDPNTFGERDADGDGFIDAACCNFHNNGSASCGRDCDDFRPSVHPIANEVCNGLDDDCDTATDEGGLLVTAYVDADGDGWGDANDPGTLLCPADILKLFRTPRPGDCADTVHIQHPFATEICNGLDDDCDGILDEGVQGYCD